MFKKNDEKSLTMLSELGEFALIERLTKHVQLKNKSSIRGIGDDGAVIDHTGKQTLITTDLLAEGVHFDLTYTPLKHLGYKAVVVNLSDIYAMNACPTQITVSIAVSSRFTVEALEEFYSGISLACTAYGVDLVGGDTSSSISGLFISVTAIGEAEKNDITFRNTAKENDLICVSGSLGGAYTGLLVLQREKQVFKVNPEMQPKLKEYDYVLGRQLKPEARKDIIELFKEIKVKPSAMIDISDGLSSDILHICASSKLGCSIYEEKIPIDDMASGVAREFSLDPTTCALNGGEDYELLFTIPLSEHKKIKNNPLISTIGHLTHKSDGYNLIARDGSQHQLKAQGWDGLGS